MKDQIKYLIKILGEGIDELVLDIEVDGFMFNSIELDDEEIYLHVFREDFDYIFEFTELSENDQSIIYSILYNIRLDRI